jgi:hypothetical protein
MVRVWPFVKRLYLNTSFTRDTGVLAKVRSSENCILPGKARRL